VLSKRKNRFTQTETGRRKDREIREISVEEITKRVKGPQGLGGRITALDVHIETYPIHIGSLPVAVNLQCHYHRHKEAPL